VETDLARGCGGILCNRSLRVKSLAVLGSFGKIRKKRGNNQGKIGGGQEGGSLCCGYSKTPRKGYDSDELDRKGNGGMNHRGKKKKRGRGLGGLPHVRELKNLTKNG